MDISQITENWPVSHRVYVVRGISKSHTIGAIHTYQVMFLIPVISQCKLKMLSWLAHQSLVGLNYMMEVYLYSNTRHTHKKKTKPHVLNFLTVLHRFFLFLISTIVLLNKAERSETRKKT